MSLSLKIKKDSLDRLGDYLLAITVLVQYPLTLLQSFWIDSGTMAEEMAGLIRVAGSVLAVVCSIFWVIKRNLVVSLAVYFLWTLIFAHSIFLQMANLEYIMSEGIRFTLCTAVPIFLSFISIKELRIFFQVALYISLLSTVVAFFYIAYYLTGQMTMMDDIYNMSLGYALLFPTLYFMYHKKMKFLVIAFLLVLIILIAGSRGPVVPILAYFLLQKLVLGTLRDRFWLIMLLVLVLLSFPVVISLLDDWGINSRTLTMLAEGVADSDSGRSVLYDKVVVKILESPLLGYGVFSDRVFEGGVYCHNLFLELLVDFGCVLTPLMLLISFVYLSFLMKRLDGLELSFLMLLILLAIPPLLVSSSYLIDFRIPLLIGYVYMLSKKYFKIKWH